MKNVQLQISYNSVHRKRKYMKHIISLKYKFLFHDKSSRGITHRGVSGSFYLKQKIKEPALSKN